MTVRLKMHLSTLTPGIIEQNKPSSLESKRGTGTIGMCLPYICVISNALHGVRELKHQFGCYDTHGLLMALTVVGSPVG